jgi:shikimate dehydrogenase
MRKFRNIKTGENTAAMKRFAVIGNPIAHSLSPRIHKYVYKRLGIDADYSTIQCTEKQIPKIIKQLRSGQLNGINITLPLKQSFIPYLDVMDEHSKAIGAVNCIKVMDGKLIGHNTDWIGFIQAVQNAKIEISGETCIIIGAGGVARSVVYALAMNKVGKIILINRTIEQAESLKRHIESFFSDIKIKIGEWREIDKQELHQTLIINCTSVGMTPDVNDCPVPENILLPSQTIIDIIYSPFQTKLCRIGHSLGAKTQSGLMMFIYQALASLDVWFSEQISDQVQIDKLQGFMKQYC